MAKKRKFWAWTRESPDSKERTLTLNGIIAEDSWLGDEVTPHEFRDELYAEDGNIIVQICSPGGDCFAAAQIYSMLVEYPGKVTVRIDGLAASAASVVAMAGDEVQMYATSLLMIHNPATIAMGDHNEMEKAIAMLGEVKESIINAYAAKTKLARAKISHLMESESYLSAHKAVELGFADTILKREGETDDSIAGNSVLFSRREVSNAIFNKLAKVCAVAEVKPTPKADAVKPVDGKPPNSGKVAEEPQSAKQITEQKTSADDTNPSETAKQNVPDAESESHKPQGRSVDSLMERLSIIKNHI